MSSKSAPPRTGVGGVGVEEFVTVFIQVAPERCQKGGRPPARQPSGSRSRRSIQSTPSVW